MDVCPVEELETHKTEIIEHIPQKEESPEPLPPPEEAVQPEPDGEDHARAKTPSPVVSPVVSIQPETGSPVPSPPVVLQVINHIKAVIQDCYLITSILKLHVLWTTVLLNHLRIGSIRIAIWQLQIGFAIFGSVSLLLQIGIGIAWIAILKMQPAIAFLRTAILLLNLVMALLQLQLRFDVPRIVILILQFRFAIPMAGDGNRLGSQSRLLHPEPQISASPMGSPDDPKPNVSGSWYRSL